MTSTQIKILAVLGALVGILAIFTAVVFALDSGNGEPKTASSQPTATSGPATVPPTAVTAVRGTQTPSASTSPSPTRSPGTTPAPSPARAGVVVRAPVAVNIRRGPGTEFPIVVTLAAGDELPATGRNTEGSWLFVTLADGTGWVALDIIEVVNGTPASLPAVPAPTPPPPPPPTPAPAAPAAPAATRAPAASAPPATANPGVGPIRTAPPPPPPGPPTRIPTVPPP